MAEERIVTNIVANADFSNLIADVHKVTSSLAKLQEQIANSNKMLANQVSVMNRSFSDTLRSTGQFSTHFVSLQSDVEKFGKNLDSGKLKLSQYFNAFQQHAKTSGGVIRDLAKQQVQLQNAILQPLGKNAQGLMQFNVHVPRGLDAVKNKAALARQELQIMNKVVQEGAGQLINWGKNTQWAGRQLTVGLTVPIAAFGKAAADAFRQADEQLVRLQKVYGGLSATSGAELMKVRKDVSATARELAAGLGASYKDTLGLAADIAATGKTGQDLIGSIKETTRLSVLGEVDRQDAMKATLALQTAFKQNTEQLSESINFLNAVENQTSTTLGDLIEAIPKAGPVIQGLGGSVKDLALYLTAMKEGGVNASEGANALKSALASLINPTKVATDMFKGFGIDLKGIVAKDAGDLTQTILDLQAALDTLNPLQKQQALEQLFGKFQFARMNALFANLGRQGSQTLQVLDLMKASSQDLANVASRELSQVTESASGKYRRALEALKADLAGVGEQFLSINTKLIELVDKVVQFANHLPKPIKQILSLVGGLTAIAGPFIMLTGVLANFFGYILKGAMHMKAFFKGGEGWKFLTPEMLAAEKAGSLVEKTFYSDAKAAAVLELALKNLIDEFTVLEQKAKSGAISVSPALQTMAGNVVATGNGPRVVDPRHPMVGAPYSRASTHMVPRSGMTEEQRMAQTMFGFVPGSIPVNRKIGNNPQIYTNEMLPNVPGLTTIGGTSTGVVAGEAAKWHAMMATLGMQSKAELAALKKEIATTGIVGKDFMQSFEQVLPAISALTDKAAMDSAAIVAELRAGKINVDQARQQIIALNLAVEQDIAATAGAMAQSMGRTINPTVVPTLNQPVVDATGKSNMRELFKKSKTKQFIDKIAGNLGVRTSGAGYNIETTIPKRFATGNIVPGSGNQDTVPALLTPGEFVVRKGAVNSATLPILESINNMATNLPIGYMPSNVSNSILGMFGYKSRSKKSANLVGRWGMIIPKEVNDALAQKLNSEGVQGSVLQELLKQPNRLVDLNDFLLHNGFSQVEADAIKKSVARDMSSKLSSGYFYSDGGFGKIAMESVEKAIHGLESSKPGISLAFQKDRLTPGRRDTLSSNPSKHGPSPTGINIPGERKSNYGAGSKYASEFGAGQVYGHFADEAFERNTSILSRIVGFARKTPNAFALKNAQPRMTSMPWTPRLFKNSGGLIQRYAGGGLVKSMLMGTGLSMGANVIGGMIGGGLGNAISMGGNILGMTMGFGGMGGAKEDGRQGFLGSQLDKIPAKFKAPIAPANALAKSVSGLAGNLTGVGRAFGPVLRGIAGIARLASPMGLAIAGATAAIAFSIKVWKDHQEALRVNRLGYGMTAEAAQKAGMKYTDYNTKIKDALSATRALQERNKMLYESMTQANTPLKMTIEQYKKLREQVKSTMGDYIKLFDQTNRKDVGKVAIQLKAQFMAAGDSAETATAKIYALIAQSNKSNQAAAAISQKLFQNMQSMADAASQTVNTFESAMQVGDSKSQASALLTSFQAIDGAVQETIDKSKGLTTVQEAQKKQIDALNFKYQNQTKLTQGVISEIGKQNPELAKVLNTTDNITSAWSKYQLIVQGVTIDVANLSGAAAGAALQLTGIINSQTQTVPGLAKQTKEYNRLKAAIEAAKKAAKGQSVQAQIDSRKAIENLNKEIDLIKKRAQDKIDAINQTADAENAELEIKKKQLAAQQALAQGDMTSYAQTQLDIAQLTNEVQRKNATTAISKKAELDIAPLQKKIDDLNNKNQTLADSAALAGTKLSDLQTAASNLKSNMDSYSQQINNIVLNLLKNKDYLSTPEGKYAAAGAGTAGKALGIKDSVSDVAKGIVSALNKGVNANQVNVYTNAIKTGQMSYGSKNPFEVAKSSNYKTRDGGILTDEAKKSIVQDNNLHTGDYFTYNGRPYRVKSASWITNPNDGSLYLSSVDVVAGKAKGGPVIGGTPYLVGEKGPELFVPNASGSIIPNNLMGPVYNIPNRLPANMGGYSNTGQSMNNMYNINIEMNGTNVTADDVVRRFKQELALINAKEGRSKTIGGGR